MACIIIPIVALLVVELFLSNDNYLLSFIIRLVIPLLLLIVISIFMILLFKYEKNLKDIKEKYKNMEY